MVKLVAGLGNPGPRYDDTRHNVGWWMADRLAFDWGLETFRREGSALVTAGSVGDCSIRLLKPTTYMNRSGVAVAANAGAEGVDVSRDLLVIVDDAMLDVGRVKFRPAGGSGGHNGLRSVGAALGTTDFARLRIGVGVAPAPMDLSDWVLSAMPPEDEDAVVALLTELTPAVELWLEEGTEAVMNRFNR